MLRRHAGRLILELFRGSFYAHDVGSEIDNIFPALPSIF